jgi:peptidoglycan DL-endopeptidase CwlO
VPSLRYSCRATLVLAATAALACGMTPVLAASAKPVYPSAKEVQDARAAASSKAAQVSAVQARYAAASARLAEVQNQAEAAAESYNGARLLLSQRTAAARSAGERASAADRTARVASDKVGQLAAQAYMQGGGFSGLETLLSSNGPQDVLDRASGMAVVSDLRTQVLQQASATSVVAGVLQRQAAQAQAQQLAAARAAESARAQAQATADAAQAETATIQRQQGQLVAQLASLRHTSVALEGKRQAGLKAEAEARAAAAAKAEAERQAREAARREAARQEANRQAAARREAARRAAERSRQRRQSAPAPVVVAPPAPAPVAVAPPAPVDPPTRTHGGAGAVIAFAQAQMGEPYVWGAEGPGSWDCSGLTMRAWEQAGVYLSHYTGAQWAETSHVPVSQARPGDLVFYGVSGAASHHVGLYIGGGQMIEAPHTGANVRVSSIWRSDLIMEVGRP